MRAGMKGWLDASLPGVHAGCACRDFAGVSMPPYGPANFGAQMDPGLEENRRRLVEQLDLPSQPRWLRQTHGATVSLDHREIDADAAISSGEPLAILTADCLPILLARSDGAQIAAIHAGWRGLAAGVIEATLGKLSAGSAHYRAWIGPAIGLDAFEIGPEVREALLMADRGAEAAFRPGRGDRWFADLPLLARRRLATHGVETSGGQWCTASDARRFHSFRRDGDRSGRMASLIWIP